jgi:V8-like Glu-specific endopeptidase
MVVVWMLVLSFLVFPSQNMAAQSGGGDERLFLPSVMTIDGEEDTAPSGLVARKDVSLADQETAEEFWTREAIAAAMPMELPIQMGPATVDEAAVAAAEVGGIPGSTAAGAAAPGADAAAQTAFAEDWAAIAAGLDSPSAVDGSSQVYTHYIANQAAALANIYPNRWVGRLSFSTPSGTSNCSATSISGNNIVTAAHCIYDTTNNRWYSNWVFSPSYRNGSAPYGTFVAQTCWVLTTWINLTGGFNINTWSQHDVAVCKMRPNSAGTTLNNAVGWAGRQWNWPYARHFHILGYPFNDYNDAAIANAGRYLHACVAESFQQTTETRGAGCFVSRGMSGGPWLIGYAPTVATGAVDGVSSGFFIGTQNLYGPRFNSNNIVLLCAATVAAC